MVRIFIVSHPSAAILLPALYPQCPRLVQGMPIIAHRTLDDGGDNHEFWDSFVFGGHHMRWRFWRGCARKYFIGHNLVKIPVVAVAPIVVGDFPLFMVGFLAIFEAF